GRLLTVPEVVQNDMPGFFFAQAEADGAQVVAGMHRREDFVAAALAALRSANSGGQSDDAASGSEPSPSLVADFLALGFCYLQTEVLTRRMRYMSNLDE